MSCFGFGVARKERGVRGLIWGSLDIHLSHDVSFTGVHKGYQRFLFSAAGVTQMARVETLRKLHTCFREKCTFRGGNLFLGQINQASVRK